MQETTKEVAASIDVSLLINKLIAWVTTNGIKLIIGVIILWIGWKVINKMTQKTIGILARKNVDVTLRSFLSSFLSVALKTILVIIVMNYVGIDTTALAALIASAGLAIGLALQGSLSNFAGGVIILIMRPFRVGDVIETGGYTGQVEHIKIFYTHLLTPDNKEILIPNGPLANGSLINYTSKDTRRVDITFGVSYDADITAVKKALFDVMSKNDLILQNPQPFVGITAHADSSVNIVVRAWTKTEDYWIVYFYLMEEVKLRFDQENIEIPYPKMDVYMNKNN